MEKDQNPARLSDTSTQLPGNFATTLNNEPKNRAWPGKTHQHHTFGGYQSALPVFLVPSKGKAQPTRTTLRKALRC
jgi:hypothetical protein